MRIDPEQVAGVSNLTEATALAARGKRDRPAVQRFLQHLEKNLARLSDDILAGRVPRGDFRRFAIRDPKPRIIHAAAFADRVLHHAIMLPAAPVLERAMTATSYACRPGKGALRAVQAVQAGLRRHPWYVQTDILGYFEHIDQQILLELLSRRYKGCGFLDLLGRIVAAYQSEPGKGLPIGALTSQHFANYYLDGLDRLLLEQLGVRAEVRYMDDTLWFCESREQARASLDAVKEWLNRERRLTLKANPRINRCRHGASFCGFRVLPGVLRLSRRRQRRYRARRVSWESAWAAGRIDASALQRGYDAVHAIVLHADSRAWRCAELLRQPVPEV